MVPSRSDAAQALHCNLACSFQSMMLVLLVLLPILVSGLLVRACGTRCCSTSWADAHLGFKERRCWRRCRRRRRPSLDIGWHLERFLQWADVERRVRSSWFIISFWDCRLGKAKGYMQPCSSFGWSSAIEREGRSVAHGGVSKDGDV